MHCVQKHRYRLDESFYSSTHSHSKDRIEKLMDQWTLKPSTHIHKLEILLLKKKD